MVSQKISVVLDKNKPGTIKILFLSGVIKLKNNVTSGDSIMVGILLIIRDIFFVISFDISVFFFYCVRVFFIRSDLLYVQQDQ